MNNLCAVVGYTFFGSTTFAIAQGMRRLGWEVIEVSPSTLCYSSKGIIGRAIRKVAHHTHIALYNKEILNVARDRAPSAAIFVKGVYVSSETLRQLKSYHVTTVNYYPDFRFSYPGVNEKDFPLYDHFFTTKSFQVDYLGSRLGSDKVTYLPHGYCPDAHSLAGQEFFSSRYEYDLLYVGSYTSLKGEWLKAIRTAFPSARFAIYGNGWDKADPVLHGAVVGREIHGVSYARAVYLSRINLAVHMGVADETGWSDLVSTRSFEIPACKGFMLHIDNPEIREYFEPGSEFDVFSSPAELCEKIDWYLAKDQVREEMLERAYARCVPHYSYHERGKVISDWIRKNSA